MTEKQTVDLFTIGLVIGENGKMAANNKEELVEYLADDFYKPVNFNLLVALPTVQEKTPGGIFLAAQTLDDSLVGNNIGRVLGKGSTVGGTNGNYAQCRDIEIGDYVSYNPHAGLPENYDGHKVICMNDSAIKGIIPDPTKHTDGIFNSYSIKGIK